MKYASFADSERQQEGTKGQLEGPEGQQDWSEGLPKGSEALPEGSEGLLEGSEGLPEGSKGLSEGLARSVTEPIRGPAKGDTQMYVCLDIETEFLPILP